jgi:predicted transcriptional regulator
LTTIFKYEYSAKKFINGMNFSSRTRRKMQALSEIKRLRKKHDLNQKELADKSGVSQSLIAKIESGKVEPTFSKAQKIFLVLEEMREKKEIKAKEIMRKKVFFVEMSDSIKNVISLMKNKGISQIPVLSQGRVAGMITEGSILKSTLKDPHKISNLKAEEIMEDAPPIVSPNTGLKILRELLRDYPIVLVSEKGDVKGIVSKSDLLGRIE